MYSVMERLAKAERYALGRAGLEIWAKTNGFGKIWQRYWVFQR